MDKVLGLLKCVAIYYGLKTIIGFVTFRFITMENFDLMYDTNSLIAVLLTLACLRAEKVEIVVKAKTKKSKFKYFILVLITLGAVVYFYKRRKSLFI